MKNNGELPRVRTKHFMMMMMMQLEQNTREEEQQEQEQHGLRAKSKLKVQQIDPLTIYSSTLAQRRWMERTVTRKTTSSS